LFVILFVFVWRNKKAVGEMLMNNTPNEISMEPITSPTSVVVVVVVDVILSSLSSKSEKNERFLPPIIKDK